MLWDCFGLQCHRTESSNAGRTAAVCVWITYCPCLWWIISRSKKVKEGLISKNNETLYQICARACWVILRISVVISWIVVCTAEDSQSSKVLLASQDQSTVRLIIHPISCLPCCHCQLANVAGIFVSSQFRIIFSKLQWWTVRTRFPLQSLEKSNCCLYIRASIVASLNRAHDLYSSGKFPES